MRDSSGQIILTIVAVIVVFLFLGFLFLVMLLYYNNKKKQMKREQESMKDNFDKQLLQSKLEIQEDTFNMISQEIHDNVGQILSLAKVQANIMDEKDVMDRTLLVELKSNISKAMSDLRDIAKSLSSERVQFAALTESVNHEVQRINKSGYALALLKVSGEEHTLPEQKKLILFRIIQESLQNILKHANASEINITFNYLPEELQISIQDNGIGFSVENEFAKKSGLGLSNIVNRAAMIGGKAQIESSNISGTQITIKLPYA